MHRVILLITFLFSTLLHAAGEKFLAVTIKDKAGNPVAGVKVIATSGSIPDPLGAESGVDGIARVPLGKTAQDGLTLRFAAPGWFALPQNFEKAPEKIDVTMVPGGAIGGTVLGADGKPLPGALLTIDFEDKPPGAGEDAVRVIRRELAGRQGINEDVAAAPQIETDAAGRWKHDAAPRGGKVELSVSHAAHLTGIFSVGDGGNLDAAALFENRAEMKLAPPLRVRGRVARGGMAVAGAAVHFAPPVREWPAPKAPPELKTDAEGRFEISLRDTGKMPLAIITKDSAPLLQKIEITAQMKDLDLTLDDGRPLKGTMTGAGGRALAGVPVLLTGWENMRFTTQPVICTTDADGSIAWQRAPKANVLCMALLPSGATQYFYWQAEQEKPLALKFTNETGQ